VTSSSAYPWCLKKVSEGTFVLLIISFDQKSFTAVDALFFRFFHMVQSCRLYIVSDIVVDLLTDSVKSIPGILHLLVILFSSILQEINFLFIVVDALFKCFGIDLPNDRLDILFNVRLHHLYLIKRLVYDSLLNRLLLII
jgi:hypothetical protein